MEQSNNNFNGSDANFNVFQTNLAKYLAVKQAEFTLLADETTKLTALSKKWNEAYAAVINPTTKTKVTVQAKNDARKEYVAFLRLLVDKYIQSNDRITNDTRRALGLTVKDKTPTPVPVPTDIPFMEIYKQNPLEHSGTLWSNTIVGEKKTNKKRPAGVAFAVVRWLMTETAPKEIDDLKHIIITSDSNFRLHFSLADVGKKVFYTACWGNSKGEMGDWCKLIEATIN